ncbi:hypothetical protein [Martelella sp. AMO21009]
MTARHPLTEADCAAMRRALWPAILAGLAILIITAAHQLAAYDAAIAASTGV